MDFIKAPLSRIPKQLQGLTLTQRMLAGSLVAVMVLTMLLWSRYASTADLEPIVDESITTDAAGPMADALQRHGIETKLVGDKLYVASDRKNEAVMWLTYDRKLPENVSDGFERIFKQMSPFDTGSRDEVMLNEAKQISLAQVFSSFPHVQEAKVLIDGKIERRIGDTPAPVAYVNFITDGNADVSKLVQSAAQAVVGAQRGMKVDDVAITVDGIAKRARDPRTGVGDDMYDEIATQESRIQQKLMDAFAYMKKPLIGVSAEKSLVDSRESSVKYDSVLSKEKRIESKSEDTSQATPPAAEAGAVPNAAISLAPSTSAGGSSTNSETDSTDFDQFPNVTRTETTHPAGLAVVTSVSIEVPRSYLVMVYRKQQANPPQVVADAELAPVLASEVDRARGIIQHTAGIKSAADVYVTSYDDEIALPSSPALAAATNSGAASTVGTLLGGHARELAIGALAAVSMVMVTMMARKGGSGAGSAPLAGGAGREAAEAKLEESAILAGEGGQALEGVELDDDSLRAQQMVEQVSTMVKQDPEAAAAMIKRWLNRT
jgi:flagellar biosynthesis/type III secretory pathway M-ring protein FliF/YscJ